MRPSRRACTARPSHIRTFAVAAARLSRKSATMELGFFKGPPCRVDYEIKSEGEVISRHVQPVSLQTNLSAVFATALL